MRVGWTASGAPTSGSIAHRRAVTSKASGGVVTTSMAMTDVLMSRVVHHDVETCTGSDHGAPGLAHWLGLAAAPTFAIMASWIAFFGGQPDMLCMAMQDSSPMSRMTVMYLLMGAFHAAPWLRLISSRRSGAYRVPGLVSSRVAKSDKVIK